MLGSSPEDSVKSYKAELGFRIKVCGTRAPGQRHLQQAYPESGLGIRVEVFCVRVRRSADSAHPEDCISC